MRHEFGGSARGNPSISLLFGYHQRSRRQRDTAGSVGRFSSRWVERPDRAGCASSQTVAPPAQAAVVRRGPPAACSHVTTRPAADAGTHSAYAKQQSATTTAHCSVRANERQHDQACDSSLRLEAGVRDGAGGRLLVPLQRRWRLRSRRGRRDDFEARVVGDQSAATGRRRVR
jgi:hypothetical protein